MIDVPFVAVPFALSLLGTVALSLFALSSVFLSDEDLERDELDEPDELWLLLLLLAIVPDFFAELLVPADRLDAELVPDEFDEFI